MKPKTMNPRQRQGLLLLLVSLIGLIGVFVLISNYVSTVSKQVGPKVQVAELAAPLPAYHRLTESMVKEVSEPAKWVPNNAIVGRNYAALLGQVSPVALTPGTVLQQGMLGPPPLLQPGYTEVSVPINAVTGVAGQIPPGGLVDVIATTQNVNGDDVAHVLVSNVEVLSGDQGQALAQSDNTGQSSSVVTLEVKASDAVKIDWAEQYAASISLVYLPAGENNPAVPPAYKQPNQQ